MVSIKIAEQFGLPNNLQFFVSAVVAALTVGGKAIGKDFANKNSTKIVYGFGKLLSNFKEEK